jgi:general secretion pathway protein D
MKLLTSVAIAILISAPAFASAADDTPPRVVVPSFASEPTVDLGELIGKVAKKTGKLFVLEGHVSGSVSMAGIDPDRVDYETLLAILRLNGMATFTQNGLVNVFPDASARQQPVPTITADDPKIGDDELVTRLVQVRNICVAHTVPILRPLMPQYAHLAAFPASNTLVVMDRAANVRRIADLAERLDKAAPAKQNCGEGKSSS